MNALFFAWRSLTRQPARAVLGILGVAAVGALLFDMLLLSNGLVLSMRDMLDRAGFDLRVMASDAMPRQGPRLPDAIPSARRIRALPAVRAAIAVRFANADVDVAGMKPIDALVQAVDVTESLPWTILRGRDLPRGDEEEGARRVAAGRTELLVNQQLAGELHLEPGARVRVRASCTREEQSLPPVTFTVIGIASFPFNAPDEAVAATTLDALDAACGGARANDADMILVASREGFDPPAVAAAIATVVPDLRVLTNAELVGRLEQGGFSYFRQISTVLTTVTLTFAVLLITVLLTVSVNQRVGDIAALRALGFTRLRVVLDVLCESALIVGVGGLVSLPLGSVLATGLDAILKRIPGIPEDVHFFVFQPRAVGIHILLLTLTALVAAAYPMYLVARMPIAATLRNEVVS